MTADLALAADPGFLERSADPAEFVIQACERAKVWLQKVLDHGDIDQIVLLQFRAEDVRAYATRKPLSEGAQLAATEIIRRAERAAHLACQRGRSAGRPGEVQDWIAAYTAGSPGETCKLWPFTVSDSGYGRAWNPRTKRMDAACRVVWEAVNGTPFGPGEACHHCGNGHIGCVNWIHVYPGTHCDNMDDRRAHGRTATGSANGNTTLNETDIRDICERLAVGAAAGELALTYGVSTRTVERIWRGKTWAHVQCVRLADLPAKADQQDGGS